MCRLLSESAATKLRNFQLEVDLVAIVDTDDAALADALAQEAHQVCPYSHATRGNIHGEPSLRKTR